MAPVDDDDDELYGGGQGGAKEHGADIGMGGDEGAAEPELDLELEEGEGFEGEERGEGGGGEGEDDDDDGVDVIIDQDDIAGGTPRASWGGPQMPNRKYVRKGVEVKVGENAGKEGGEEAGAEPGAPGAKPASAGVAVNPYELDISAMDEKPWRKPGADLSDWFNFGFNEETWHAYCQKQLQLRRLNTMSASIQVVDTGPRDHQKQGGQFGGG
ncbi:Fip1 motif-domain-containing protein, partial [Baffinella frigidus]